MKTEDMKFEKMVDKTAAYAFARQFETRFVNACVKEFGQIIPNDRSKLKIIAERVIAEWGD